jgi:cytochrome c nitrite reductase small subunit
MSIDAFTSFYYTIFIIFLFVVICLSLFLLFTRGNTKLKRLKFWLILILTVACIVLVLVVGTVSIFSTSSSCNICHEMNPNFITWKNSKHSHVPCLSCHFAANNTIGFIAEEPQGLIEVYQHITGSYPKIINKDSSLSQQRMKSGVCLRCHQAKRPNFVVDEVKINHNAHVNLGITCETCHNRVIHKGARGYFYLNGLRMMDGCMRCHSPGKPKIIKGEKAPTACTTCHLKKNIAQEALNATNPTVSDFSDCEGCHQIRNPEIVNQYKQSIMMTEGGLTCQSCHKDHLSNEFVPFPDPVKCEKCHKKIARLVVEKKHGSKDFQSPFKKASQVRCNYCHPDHIFKPVNPQGKK